MTATPNAPPVSVASKRPTPTRKGPPPSRRLPRRSCIRFIHHRGRADVVPPCYGHAPALLLGAAAGLLLQSCPRWPTASIAALPCWARSRVWSPPSRPLPRRPVDGQLWLLGSVHLDMLAALMLLVISVGVAVALYSFAYIREYQGKGDVAIGADEPLPVCHGGHGAGRQCTRFLALL